MHGSCDRLQYFAVGLDVFCVSVDSGVDACSFLAAQVCSLFQRILMVHAAPVIGYFLTFLLPEAEWLINRVTP